MTLVGEKVVHITPSGKPGVFGKGTIVEKSSKKRTSHICVKFDNIDSIKEFSYPDCFGKYLKLEDPELAEKMKEVLFVCSKEKEQAAKSLPSRPEDAESPDRILAELDSLIGLEDVKNDVRILTSFIRAMNLRKSRGLKEVVISKHLVFTGNPGTGKTTVARIISRIYYSIGAISENKFVETSRAGLVAGYLGQTALKTQSVINSALGGVLFIDEAYSLAGDSKNDYGSEAIDTLLSAMENYRDNLVVIVAGYEEQMKDFLNMNPGLASRFNRYLHFEDYNSENLMSIFIRFCNENDYVLRDDAKKSILNYLSSLYSHRGKDFGNARTVRNIFEKVITYQAERIIKQESISDVDLIELTQEDIEAAILQAA